MFKKNESFTNKTPPIENGKIPGVWKAAYVAAYSIIERWKSIVLEGLISNQLEEFSLGHGILNYFQSGFRKQVLNDIIKALDTKMYCAASFLDPSKAPDTVRFRYQSWLT